MDEMKKKEERSYLLIRYLKIRRSNVEVKKVGSQRTNVSSDYENSPVLPTRLKVFAVLIASTATRYLSNIPEERGSHRPAQECNPERGIGLDPCSIGLANSNWISSLLSRLSTVLRP